MRSPTYTTKPAPRSNPEGRLDGAWVVLNESGATVARFSSDGRDRAESWVAERRTRWTLSDFRVGDVLILHGRTRSGWDPRGAVVTAVDYQSNGMVTAVGHSVGDLLPSGQGAFDPTKVGTSPFGFTVQVEKVGRVTPVSSREVSLYRNPGYDLCHDPVRG